MNSSSIKNFLYSFLLNSLIFYVTTKIVTGIQTSGQATHWLMAYAVFAAANALVPHMLRFFTLPGNFFAYWLMSAILSFVAIYIMSMLLPGIIVRETIIDPVGMGLISINPYTLSPIFTMVAGGLVAGVFGAAFDYFNNNK